MLKTLLIASISLTLTTLTGNAFAQGGGSGKTKAAACAGCHGEDGNSAMPGFPKLAGQHKGYLVKQLQAFKNGNRISSMMGALAAGLDDRSIDEIADYYAANRITANPAPALPDSDDEDTRTEAQKKEEMASLIAAGGNLYRNGDLATAVSACIACHGPFGEGNRPGSFPSLHSQHADYLIKTLTDFKNGNRTKSRENMMYMIASKMSDQEIKAVAYYISTLK
ncbi:MAG: c-type cytochrome [Methylococcales bacterium]|nr:c-type cytochrome [Methylococcales bacterium]